MDCLFDYRRRGVGYDNPVRLYDGGVMKREHWDGNKNKSIRLYFYSQRGLALFNEFRYLFMIIFGVYMLMKLSNPVWLVVMFMISTPILIVCGWFQVHHMAKVINWLDVEFASHWTRYGFDLQERQVKALESIDSKTGVK